MGILDLIVRLVVFLALAPAPGWPFSRLPSCGVVEGVYDPTPAECRPVETP